MENVKISIIVPAYNIAPYLPRCLDSILAQTHTNMEVLVVDDGSTDETGAIIDAYAQKDARIVPLHQENSGVVKARFAGMHAATGEWIGFVDGDDLIAPDMYERLLKNALDHGADISHCGYQMVFPNRVDYYYNTGRLAQQDKLTGLYDLLDGSMIEPGLCNKLFHKSLFHSLLHSGVEDAGYRINEDLLMNFYLFREAEKAVYEDFCPYEYIVREGSAATKMNECHFCDPVRVRALLCEMTAEQPTLYYAALRIYVRSLISNMVQKHYPTYAKEAKYALKQLFREKKAALLPRKERYMAWLTVNMLPLYRLIRWGYEKVTRVNHKYDLE